MLVRSNLRLPVHEFEKNKSFMEQLIRISQFMREALAVIREVLPLPPP